MDTPKTVEQFDFQHEEETWLERLKQRFGRKLRFFWQRRRRGWDDSETWSLDYKLSEYILPRLKRFREIGAGVSHPCSLEAEEWEQAVDDMIYAHEMNLVDAFTGESWDSIDWDRVQRGFELFGKYYRDLWW